MVLEYTQIDVQPGKEDAWEAVQKQIDGLMAKVPGCRSHEVSRCVETPNRYLVAVGWDTLEDHVEGFVGSDAFNELLGVVGPFVAGPPAIQHFVPLSH